jgi:hypothetical protein
VAHGNSPIVAVARTPARLDVFWIAPDGSVMSSAWEAGVNDDAWSSAPISITRPGVSRFDSPLAVVSRTPNRLDLFWIGPDGNIGSAGWEAGANNNAWESDFPIASRPGVTMANSPIAAVSRTPRRLDVFWVGPDGNIGSAAWERGVKNNAWQHDIPIAQPGAAVIDP